MKKYMAFALAFLLVATLFTACGRGSVSKDPGGMITDSMVTTESTHPEKPVPTTTAPATEKTEPSASTDAPSMPDESEHPTLANPVNSSAVAQKAS